MAVFISEEKPKEIDKIIKIFHYVRKNNKSFYKLCYD